MKIGQFEIAFNNGIYIKLFNFDTHISYEKEQELFYIDKYLRQIYILGLKIIF